MARMIAKGVLDDIRTRCDIVDLIGQHLTLHRSGGTFKALCPFHKEKTPSFHVNPQRQIFHCFGCGAGGDVFGFIMQQEGVPFTTAVAMLAEKAGVPLETEDEPGSPAGDKQQLFKVHEGVAQFYQRCLREARAAAHARTYLETRALDDKIVEQFLVGYAPESWDAVIRWGAKHDVAIETLEAAGLLSRSDRPDARQPLYDRFRNRLMFPIRDEQGRVIGFSGRALDPEKQPAKYVNSPETLLFKKSRVLYAIDRARRKIADLGEAIVCEGQIDVIRCHAAGFENAVAAQGTAFTEDHARIIRRYADSVTLVFDPDVAGQDASVRAAGVFLKSGLAVRVGTLPPGQDPDALIRAGGAAAFQAVLDAAGSAVAFQIAVLAGREDASSGVGAMRISKAVLQTVALSPNAVLRAKLLQEAAARLGIPESALQDDLRFLQARESRPREAPATPGEAGVPASISAAASPEEVELCEHLAQHAESPEVAALVEQYLPFDLLEHAACRRVAQACMQAAREGSHLHGVLEAAGEVDPELLRFAAAVQSAPPKVIGREVSRSDAVRDLILRIWRRHLRARRALLDADLKRHPSKETRGAKVQLTLDLDALKSWEHGAPVIEIEVAHRG